MIANLRNLGKFVDPQILPGERSGTFRDSANGHVLPLYSDIVIYEMEPLVLFSDLRRLVLTAKEPRMAMTGTRKTIFQSREPGT